MVTPGLPSPGWSLLDVAPVPLPDETSSSSPQPTASAAMTARITNSARVMEPSPWFYASARSAGTSDSAGGTMVCSSFGTTTPVGVRRRWTYAEQAVDREREHDGDDRRGDHALEAVGGLVDDDVAEAAAARERGQRRRGDDVDGGRADAGEDQRPRQRQLDHAQHLALAHAHPARGLDGVRVDLVDGRVGVGEDRRQRERDERDRDVEDREAEEGEADGDQRQARQRAQHVRDVDGHERAAMAMAEQDADRQRDRDRDHDRQRADGDVLEQPVDQQAALLGEEVEDVAHVAALRARAHGVIAHWTQTINPSAISASAIARTLAATNSVLAPVWIALKIGAPSPSGVM